MALDDVLIVIFLRTKSGPLQWISKLIMSLIYWKTQHSVKNEFGKGIKQTSIAYEQETKYLFKNNKDVTACQ